MTCKELLKSLKKQDFTTTNLILHFRIGTSGFNDKMNCHPYPIYQKNALNCKTDLAMAHNGILQGYIPPKTSDINDTQVFIQNVLSGLKKGFLDDTDKLMLIEEIIGTNKLAFLDSRNKLTTIGNFIEDGGYIYSNNSYKKHETKKVKYTYSNSIKEFAPYCYEDLFNDVDETGFWKDWDSRY